ncbi:hypothetical protein SVIOM342S_06126 [Streptomyces violaceorubidus]
MADDAAVLLVDAGQEAGYVQKGDDRDVEGVAHLDEARGLLRCLDVQYAGQALRLVGDDADDLAVQTGQGADDVAGPALVDLQVLAVVDEFLDDLGHVVGAVAVRRDQVEQDVAAAVCGVRGLGAGRVLPVVLRQQGEEVADLGEAGLLVVVGEVAHAGRLGVHVGAAQAVLGDLLAGDRLDHVRARDEHLRGVADHEDEVGEGGAVGRAARARAEHHADLRDDAGRLGVALEDAAVTGERADALLDAGAGAVVQRHQRGTGRDGHVHDLVDLRRVRLAQRTAEDPEVVGVDEDRAALDRAPAGDDTVGVRLLGLQAEAGRPVPAQLLDLAEGTRVEEQLDPLARRQLALGVLRRRGLLARSGQRLRTDLVQLGHSPARVRRLTRRLIQNGHVATLRSRPRNASRRLRTVSGPFSW